MAMLTEQRNILSLWHQVNASLSAYYKLVTHFGTVTDAILASTAQWQALGIHSAHLKRREQLNGSEFLSKVEAQISEGQYAIVTIDDDGYPNALRGLYDPPPILFYRGSLSRLSDAQIAMVGSRKPTAHAEKVAFDMAQYFVQQGYTVVSGLAQGIDVQAHLGALQQHCADMKGRTVGVMGTGIDVCYPRHHDSLFAKIVAEGGCLLSELLPSTPASRHTFPRRNRLVAGLSLGTIIVEAKKQSGSLITARLATEQGKQVFAVPSHIDNVNAEGCHHLIREGATLIYHPEQVLEDLHAQHVQVAMDKHVNVKPMVNYQQTTLPMSSPTSLSKNHPPSLKSSDLPNLSEIPTHLSDVYEALDWAGQDIDELMARTHLDTSVLLSQLMELEILGKVQQLGGRYTKI